MMKKLKVEDLFKIKTVSSVEMFEKEVVLST